MMRSVLVLWIGMTAMSPALADEGIWHANENFAQVHTACYRVYECRTGKNMFISGDETVVTSSNKIIWGVCSAAGGAADSCNTCLTSKPNDACTWEIKKKN